MEELLGPAVPIGLGNSDSLLDAGEPYALQTPLPSREQFVQAQQQDADMQVIRQWVTSGHVPSKHDLSYRSPEVLDLHKQLQFLFIEPGSQVLCRQLPGGHRQAVLPQELRIQVINWSHLQLSHLGAGKVIAYLQTWAWWPKMGAMTKNN